MGKLHKMKSERETNQKRLLTIGNKLKVAGGKEGGDGVAGLWALRKACDVMSAGCYMQLMSH